MKKKIGIVTSGFRNFDPAYSLVGVVLDQVKMLERYGHQVDIYVSEKFIGPEQSNIIKTLPRAKDIHYIRREDFGKLKPNTHTKEELVEHKSCPERMAKALMNMPQYDFVFVHDIFFNPTLLPYYLGLERAVASGKLKTKRWLHWIHSMPYSICNWWDMGKLGKSHKVVFPSRAERHLVSSSFRGNLADVQIIPHIRDLRTIGRFNHGSWKFIDKYPELMQADIVQIYPSNTVRMFYKRVPELIMLFGCLKQLGFSVCLVIVNHEAGSENGRKLINSYRKLASRHGLTPNEIIFTSQFQLEWEMSVPQGVVFDLMRCANLFIFPTRDESFGLVLPEALLSGGALPVVNKDLDVLSEMLNYRGLRFRFGTIERKLNYKTLGGRKTYFQQIASAIVRQLSSEEAIAARTICRQTLNMDAIYKKYYLPLIGP